MNTTLASTGPMVVIGSFVVSGVIVVTAGIVATGAIDSIELIVPIGTEGARVRSFPGAGI